MFQNFVGDAVIFWGLVSIEKMGRKAAINHARGKIAADYLRHSMPSLSKFKLELEVTEV